MVASPVGPGICIAVLLAQLGLLGLFILGFFGGPGFFGGLGFFAACSVGLGFFGGAAAGATVGRRWVQAALKEK